MAGQAFEVYETTELETPINSIQFDPIPVSEQDEKTVFVKNMVDGSLTITDVTVEGDNIQVEDFTRLISEDSVGRIELSANPSADSLSGLNGTLNIEAEYILRA